MAKLQCALFVVVFCVSHVIGSIYLPNRHRFRPDFTSASAGSSASAGVQSRGGSGSARADSSSSASASSSGRRGQASANSRSSASASLLARNNGDYCYNNVCFDYEEDNCYCDYNDYLGCKYCSYDNVIQPFRRDRFPGRRGGRNNLFPVRRGGRNNLFDLLGRRRGGYQW